MSYWTAEAGEKLERYGKFILSRPDPQALWNKSLPVSEWQKLTPFLSIAEQKGVEEKAERSGKMENRIRRVGVFY